MPPAPPAKRRGGKIALIVVLVVLLLVCPCLGLVGWAVWKAADNDSDAAAPAPSLSAPVVPPVLPSDLPSPNLPSPDEEEFAKGDCVVNDGSEDDADLRKVPCGPNTYQVLLRIPATTDGDRCKTLAPQATANYVHDNTIDVLDYVLCLKKR
ncbi:LppU/SCO3897 family protein [Micromonospora lupini]|uniref:LppU/SCO3897 family protein n=1 Tax=Micromonospora lupini TaxID=285679 RepID=UPI0031D5AEEE